MISNKVYQDAVKPPPPPPQPTTFQQRTGHLHSQPGQYSQAQYPGGQGGGQPRPSAAKFGRINTPPPPGNMKPPQGPPARPQPGMRTGAVPNTQGFRAASFQDLSSGNVPSSKMPGAAAPHFPGQGAAPRASYSGMTSTGLPGSNPLGDSKPRTLGSAPPPKPHNPPHTKLPPKPFGPAQGTPNREFYDQMRRRNFASGVMKKLGLGGKMLGVTATPLQLADMHEQAKQDYMVDNNIVGYEEVPPEQIHDGTYDYDIMPGEYDDQGGTAPMGFQPNMVDNPEYQGALHYLIHGTDPIKGQYNPYTDGI